MTAPRRLRPVDAVVVDAEVRRCIPSPKEPRQPGLEYCRGWTDYVGMGVSVACAFDTRTRSPRVFCLDNLGELADLVAGRVVVTFNGDRFDRRLLAAHGVEIPDALSYDLRLAVLRAAGVANNATGYQLGDLARVNLGEAKRMSGALAPVAWQQRRYGEVVDYCLDDVMKTARLVQLATLMDPNTGALLELAPVNPPLAEVAA